MCENACACANARVWKSNKDERISRKYFTEITWKTLGEKEK